jgi:hypothetical protein
MSLFDTIQSSCTSATGSVSHKKYVVLAVREIVALALYRIVATVGKSGIVPICLSLASEVVGPPEAVPFNKYAVIVPLDEPPFEV